MSAAHPWAAEPAEITLPSGLTVKVRPVAMQQMIRVGAISPELMDAISGELEDPKAKFEVMAIIAEKALIEPRATLNGKANPAKGIYAIDTIPDGDLAAIFAWSQGSDLESFRGDRAGAGTREGREVLGDDSEPAA